MPSEIRPIVPEFLDPEILRECIYPDLEHDLYWTDAWEPGFYAQLARSGFISVCHDYGEPDGCLLLPELQTHYATLEWPDRHCPRSLRRRIRSGWIDSEDMRLRLTQDIRAVTEGIASRYGAESWLLPPYRELISSLALEPPPGFSVLAVELWSGNRGFLLGGELGYACGATYTSLSGFIADCSHFPDGKTLGGRGTVQLLALSRLLENCGYAFWNLGHPYMQYKLDLGCRVLERSAFLGRWLPRTSPCRICCL
jgi:hypothetical protein